MKRGVDREDYGRWEADSTSGGKFWTISREGTSVTTTWGKLGSEGQSNTKDFPTEDKAAKFVTSTIAKKEKEGYGKADGGSVKKSAIGGFDNVPATGQKEKAIFDAWAAELFSSEHRGGEDPLTDEMVVKVQNTLKLCLPPSYVHLCRSMNGGSFSQSISHWVNENVELTEIGGIGDSLVDQYANTKDEWEVPEWLIPIGGDGHGWVCFDYRKAAARKTGQNVPIVSVYQDDDWEPEVLAPDFEAFLTFMKNLKDPGEGDEEDNDDDE